MNQVPRLVVRFSRSLSRAPPSGSIEATALPEERRPPASFDQRSGLELPRLTEKMEQCRVDLFGVGPADVVWTALDRNKRAVGNQRRKPRRGHLERKDAIVGAVQDEHGNVDVRQVGAEVGQPGVDAGVGGEG